ncbi:hypothetical protein HDU97_001368 [Phlyctochytrium planicorne]|nr:hypothetical protein HDU97_001368 [Phlyctochytrium planicorne]
MFRAARFAAQRRFLSSAPATTSAGEKVFVDVTKPSSWPSVKDTMLAENLHAKEHAKGSTKFWFNLNLIFTIPALAAIAYVCLPKELAHIHHLHEHPNEYVPHPHLRKRKNVSFAVSHLK